MRIYKNDSSMRAIEFTETANTLTMPLKYLSDGSVWARVYWLNVTSVPTYFTSTSALDSNDINRYSKLSQLTSLASSKVTLKNLAPVINGATGFSTGAADSSAYNFKYGNPSLLLTGTTSGAEITASSTSACIPLVAGHAYYVRVEIKQATKQGSCDVFLGSTTAGSGVTAEGFTVKTVPVSANATWTVASAVHTLHSSIPTGNHKFRLDYNNSKTAGTMLFTGLMIIDLTEAFGSTIPTKAWCDKNLPYFTDTYTLDATDTGFKRWEFLLTYPRLSATGFNRWSQTGDPNGNAPEGYTPITTTWPTHAGPLRKLNSGSAIYNCNESANSNWYAAIGQTAAWTTDKAIPAADGSSQTETELWIRIDNLSAIQQAKIYSNGSVGGSQFYEY